MHVSESFYSYFSVCSVHFEILCHFHVENLKQPCIFVTQLWRFVFSLGSIKKVSLHRGNSSLLFCLQNLVGSVNVVFKPAKILFSWVTHWKNIVMICQYVIEVIFIWGSRYIYIMIGILMVINYYLMVIKGLSWWQKHLLLLSLI
jgi:hypothetical protein